MCEYHKKTLTSAYLKYNNYMPEKRSNENSGTQVQVCSDERLRYMNLSVQVMSKYNLGNGLLQIQRIDKKIIPNIPPNKVTVKFDEPGQLQTFNKLVLDVSEHVEQFYKGNKFDTTFVNMKIQEWLDAEAKKIKEKKDKN